MAPADPQTRNRVAWGRISDNPLVRAKRSDPRPRSCDFWLSKILRSAESTANLQRDFLFRLQGVNSTRLPLAIDMCSFLASATLQPAGRDEPRYIMLIGQFYGCPLRKPLEALPRRAMRPSQ